MTTAQLNDLLQQGTRLPVVTVEGDRAEYGGVLLQPRSTRNVNMVAVLMHGIAGDMGESAYLTKIGRAFLDHGASVLFLRSDGYIDFRSTRRVVDLRAPQVFVEIFDRTIESLSRVDSRYATASIVTVPHSLAVAKMVFYGQNNESRNAERIRGFIALSPVDVQAGFGKSRTLLRFLRTLTRLGAGTFVVPARVLRRFGGADIDWGITVSSIVTFATPGGPLDLVKNGRVDWLDKLDEKLPLARGARHIFIGEFDSRHGPTHDRQRASVRALEAAVNRTTWKCHVVSEASHSFQTEGALRTDEGQLLFEEMELTEVIGKTVEGIERTAADSPVPRSLTQ